MSSKTKRKEELTYGNIDLNRNTIRKKIRLGGNFAE